MKHITVKDLFDEKLNSLNDVIYHNKELILSGVDDTEPLHKLRVAVRKIRAIFVLLEKYFSQDDLKECKKSFNRIGKFTNTPRDLDVYLETLESFSDALPLSDQNKLDRLISILKEQKEQEYKKLIDFISSKKFNKTLKKFSYFVKGECYSTLCKHSAKSVAKDKLNSLHNDIIDKSKMLSITSSNQEFHKLRIEFKKLRYLIELFAPIYKEKKHEHLAQKLKAIQTLLGNFNDLDVQLNSLDLFITKYDLHPNEQEIIQILQVKFLKEQQTIKGKLKNSFQPFTTDEFKELLLDFK